MKKYNLILHGFISKIKMDILTFLPNNSHLLHRIIDSFPQILKRKMIRLKFTFNNYMIFTLIFVKNCLYYDAVHDFSVWLSENRFKSSEF